MDRCTLKRGSSGPDSECAKALRSTLIMRPKLGSPLLMLSPEEGSCLLYNPHEDQIYETKSDFSGHRFLGSSGKWFLVLDSRSDLNIIDVFSEERILLPPLDSIKGGRIKIDLLGDKEFNDILTTSNRSGVRRSAEKLSGLLWVDESNKDGDYFVVWHFQNSDYLACFKKGDDHYHEVSADIDVPRELRGQRHMVLKGYNLYVLTKRGYIRQLDFSGGGFKDVSVNPSFPFLMLSPSMRPANKFISSSCNLAVRTTSGGFLLAYNRVYESITTFERFRIFVLYKIDPIDLDPNYVNLTHLDEVDSLGDEALFMDLGITVPADHSLGIEPNSIYFTCADRFIYKEHPSCLDICVYNIATKSFKRFPALSNFKLKDAHWFLPC